MKYQSFIMRVLCLLLIVGVVLGYNSMQKKDSDTEKDQQIASLTTRVEALEKQQDEILSALEEAAKAQEGSLSFLFLYHFFSLKFWKFFSLKKLMMCFCLFSADSPLLPRHLLSHRNRLFSKAIPDPGILQPLWFQQSLLFHCCQPEHLLQPQQQ